MKQVILKQSYGVYNKGETISLEPKLADKLAKEGVVEVAEKTKVAKPSK